MLCPLFLLCALRCAASQQAKTGRPPQHAKNARAGARACWEQLRASLRRKEMFLFEHWAARLRSTRSLRSLRAKRSRRALTLVSWTEAR
jgi:hypothetical protein